MTSLQDIIQLCGDDNSKAFVMDDKGEIKLVVMGMGEYQKLLLGKLKTQVEDIEEINRKILEAQLQETETVKPAIAMTAEESHGMKPKQVDMRSEVIDPNFNFDAEAIKPEFEDI